MKIKFLLIIITVAIISGVVPGSAQLPERFHRYTETLSLFAGLRNSHPDIITLDTVGYSTRYDIPMLRLKISDSPDMDDDEPTAFICGGVHANEILGPEVVIGFTEDFLNRYDQNDQQVINLVNSLEIFIIPYINPEGHIVVENGQLDWRKNQCDNDSNGVFDIHDGVDNNRNYDIGWYFDNEANATTPESMMYKGTAPFTQQENIAMREFGWRYRPTVALDYHSPVYGFSEVVYYPWYWHPSNGGQGDSPDIQLMRTTASQFAGMIINDNGDSTYRARSSAVTEGDLNSYYYCNLGSMVFTVEVSDTTIVPGEVVDGIVSRNIPPIYFLLNRALQGGITGTVRDSITLEPLEAEVRVLERNNFDIHPRLSRPDNGRYNRILEPGTFTLAFIKDGYDIKIINNVAVGNSPVVNDVMLVPQYPRPPAPALLYPENGQTMNDYHINFDWSDAYLADKYLFELSADSNFVGIITRDSNLVTSQFSSSIYLPNGDYCWRVKAGNSNGWGPYAEPFRSFVENTSSIDDQPPTPSGFSLNQNYPNPFNSSTKISYSIADNSLVDLGIYSILGELVCPLVQGKYQEPGEYRYIWNGLDNRSRPAPSGIYFYRLRVGAKSSSRSMLLMR